MYNPASIANSTYDFAPKVYFPSELHSHIPCFNSLIIARSASSQSKLARSAISASVKKTPKLNTLTIAKTFSSEISAVIALTVSGSGSLSFCNIPFPCTTKAKPWAFCIFTPLSDIFAHPPLLSPGYDVAHTASYAATHSPTSLAYDSMPSMQFFCFTLTGTSKSDPPLSPAPRTALVKA